MSYVQDWRYYEVCGYSLWSLDPTSYVLRTVAMCACGSRAAMLCCVVVKMWCGNLDRTAGASPPRNVFPSIESYHYSKAVDCMAQRVAPRPYLYAVY